MEDMISARPKDWRSLVTMAFAALWLLSAFPFPARAGEKTGLDACARFFDDLEQSVDHAAVGNHSSFRVPGYPFLRTSRFLNEIRYFVTDEGERRQWLDLLSREGDLAVRKEIDNLPDSAVEQLLTNRETGRRETLPLPRDGRDTLKSLARQCTGILLTHAKEDGALSTLAFGTPAVPSEYRTGRRVLGLYPLFTPAIGTAVAHYKKTVRNKYAVPLDELKPQGRLTVLSPERPSLSNREGITAGKLLSSASENPLGIPLLERGELEWIVHHYAPILEQDVTGDYDRPGAVVWQGTRIAIQPREPTVYYYATYALHRGTPVLQLNYVLWYTKRPPVYPLDIEAGRIHGMTLRLSLLQNGKPMMVDVIHNCGCYHFFFPSKEIFKGLRTERFREDAFVPQWLPPFRPSQRLTVRIETKRHRVERLHYASSPVPDATTYRLVPYDLLESLPRASGRRESIFTPMGIVKGDTERTERFPLFSVGIPGIGSMRQRGHHATSLIGERTFDDPRLFEKFFFLN